MARARARARAKTKARARACARVRTNFGHPLMTRDVRRCPWATLGKQRANKVTTSYCCSDSENDDLMISQLSYVL